MKKSLVVACLVAFAGLAHADEQVRAVQSSLREAGFYFGKADGAMGEETRAALRRFQIRNGLDVTGTTTPETLSALKIGNVAPATRQTEVASAAAEDEQRIAQTVPEPEVATAPPPARVVRPQPREVFPSGTPQIETNGRAPMEDFFIDTDLEDASANEQSEALLKAQIRLANRGYFRASPDGRPGPETETSLLKFQHDSHLRLTGRLDEDTRRALVDAPPGVPTKPFRTSRERPSGTVLRGVWLH